MLADFETFDSHPNPSPNQQNPETENHSDPSDADPSPADFDVFSLDESEREKLSFAARQFTKRMEFNASLRRASAAKSKTSISYSSASLSAGIPELLYDADGVDAWVNYLRLYTYTPLTMGILLVPVAIYGCPDMELFPKLILGAFYLSTSALFPYFGYRAVKDKVHRAWLTPDCEKIIIEKHDFFFAPYKQEAQVRHLRVLHKKGSDRHCWFECTKSKKLFLFVSELMQHSVWLQLLGVDADQVADATMRNIANDGKVTMFRGPNTG